MRLEVGMACETKLDCTVGWVGPETGNDVRDKIRVFLIRKVLYISMFMSLWNKLGAHPASLLTTQSAFGPQSLTAAMRFSGIPTRPNPPTRRRVSSSISFTASTELS